MKISIGTVSSNVDFEETLKLIKSSLLYADEIELIGLAEYAVFCYIPCHLYEARDWNQLMDSFSILIKSFRVEGGEIILTQIDDLSLQLKEIEPILKKKKNRSKKELLLQLQMEKALNKGKETIANEIKKTISTPGINTIRSLINRKIVGVYDYNCTEINLEEISGGYFGNLMKVMRNHTAYPLFDNVSKDIISSVAKTRLFDLGNINPEILRHAGVASNILMTLPALDGASVDEILDFKKENLEALTNFRKAIFEFSEKIDSLPWDENFKYDCVKLYSTEVAPKVAELNEVSSNASVLKNLGGKVIADAEIRKAAGFAVGGIAATVLRQNGLMEAFAALRDLIMGCSLIAISPQLAAGFLKTIDLTNKSISEVKTINTDIQGNTMYYYYKASKDL